MFEHEALWKLGQTFDASVHGWEPGGDGRSFVHVESGSRAEVTENGTLRVSSERWMTAPYEFDLRQDDPFRETAGHLMLGLARGNSDKLRRALPDEVLGW